TLPVGPQGLTAVYSGDANNARGTSAVFDQDVQSPSTLTVVPSVATTTYGSTVTLTATVGTTVRSQVPTGTVVFLAGTAELGDVTLDGTGTAKVTTGTLPVGTDPITAVYSGDQWYAAVPATAPASTTVTVAAADTTTALSLAVGGAPATVAPVPGAPVAGQGSSVATYTTVPGDLPVGADQVDATFGPATGFNPSTA